MNLTPAPFLVTGGGGFLGRYIVQGLLAQGERVRIFQRSPAPDLTQQGVEVHRGSLADAAAVSEAVAGCRGVFHVAAKAGVWGPRAEYWAVNVTGTRHILAACRAKGIRHLVYTSTPSVVFSGEPFTGQDESLPYGRNWLCHYAESKALAEREVLAAHEPGRLEVCALRPHLIWGPGDPHLLPRVLAKAAAGRLTQVGEGRNRVDITHVRNAADAHLLAYEALRAGVAGGKAYFLSQGDPVNLWSWIGELLSALELPPVRRRLSLRSAYALGAVAETLWRFLPLPGEPPITRFVATELAKDHWFSIAAARRDLGYRPENHPTGPALREYIASLEQ